MTYLKSLFFNFLVVFFANHVLPGIEVVKPTKLPHIGGDLTFAIALGCNVALLALGGILSLWLPREKRPTVS